MIYALCLEKPIGPDDEEESQPIHQPRTSLSLSQTIIVYAQRYFINYGRCRF